LQPELPLRSPMLPVTSAEVRPKMLPPLVTKAPLFDGEPFKADLRDEDLYVYEDDQEEEEQNYHHFDDGFFTNDFFQSDFFDFQPDFDGRKVERRRKPEKKEDTFMVFDPLEHLSGNGENLRDIFKKKGDLGEKVKQREKVKEEQVQPSINRRMANHRMNVPSLKVQLM